MAEITRTIVYPLPTNWMVDEEDSAKSGICTYTGPDRITFWYKNFGTDDSPQWEVEHCFPSDNLGNERPKPNDCVSVELDADQYPMNAAAMWGGIEGPMQIETPAGPDTEPNPILNDYYHFNEVFDLESFQYDFENNRWGSPEFSTTDTETRQSGQQNTFGWDWVRQTRDSLLAASDNKVPSDVPESVSAPWKEYRQKLRDIPETWSSVGENTYLIVWPEEPQDNLN